MTSHGTDRKKPRGTRTGKKNDNKRLSKMAEQDSAQMGKKRGKMEDVRNGDAEKGIPQHVPKRMANQKLSKKSEPREGKN